MSRSNQNIKQPNGFHLVQSKTTKSINRFGILLLLWCCIIITACKDKIDIPEGPAPASTETPTNNPSTSNIPIPFNTSKVGTTYDITKSFDNKNFGALIINNIQLYNSEPERLVYSDLADSYNQFDAGENMLSFSEQKSRRIKASANFWIFKSSIAQEFTENNSYSSKHIYASYNQIYQRRSVKYSASAATLRKYLNKAFLDDIEQDSPEQIVARYGTSLVAQAVDGARFECLYQSETSASDRKSAASAGLSLSIKEIFSINVDPGGSKALASNNYNARLLYRTVGGDNTIPLTGDLQLGGTPQTVNINAWQKSITDKNAQVVDIQEDGLVPLDELVASPTKAAALKAYIKSYIISRQVRLVAAPIQVYEYYSAAADRHAYSTERVPTILGSYNLVGPAFKAFNSQIEGSVPIYQHYSEEYNTLMLSPKNPSDFPGFKMQNIAFYAYTTPQNGTVPFYGYFRAAKNNKRLYYDYYYSASTNPPSFEWTYRYNNHFYAFPN